jgi:hypothetical protein
MNDELIARPMLGVDEQNELQAPFIPWRENELVLVDRWDARHLLDVLPRARTAVDAVEPAAMARLGRLREECNVAVEEDDDDDDDDTGHANDNDRKRAAIAFDYSGAANKALKTTTDTSVPVAESEIPTDRTRRAVIEKTAAFVLEHGDRAEVALKLRESENPKFSFLFHTDAHFAFFQACKKNPPPPPPPPSPPPPPPPSSPPPPPPPSDP